MTATTDKYKGIDVYVGDGTIDWKKVSDSGVSFAMIKATQGYLVNNSKSGRITDSKFDYNITNASENGLYCGAYHYLMAKTVEDAESEAEYFIGRILPYKDKINLFAGVDIENDSAKKYTSKEKKLNTDILLKFCDIVERSGFKSIIYVNPNFIKNYLEFDRLSKKNIWLAYWTDKEKAMEYINASPNPGQFKLWQYGDADVIGIKKKTDGDIALFDLDDGETHPVMSVEIPDGGDLDVCLFPGEYFSRNGQCKNVPAICKGKAFLLSVKSGAVGNRGFSLQTLYDIESGKEYRRGLFTENGRFEEVQSNWR